MRDEFNRDTKLLLGQRAGLVCSNPHCHATTSGPQLDSNKALNIGVAAHITAASIGGERYDASLTPEQRGSSDNGIWLCQNCAKLIDNDPSRYTSEILRAWKTVREFEALHSIGQTAAQTVVTEQQRKAKQIMEWKGKNVQLVKMVTGREAMTYGTSRPWVPAPVKVLDCNEFFVLVRGDSWDKSRSIPMSKVDIGFDDKVNLLEILESN